MPGLGFHQIGVCKGVQRKTHSPVQCLIAGDEQIMTARLQQRRRHHQWRNGVQLIMQRQLLPRHFQWQAAIGCGR